MTIFSSSVFYPKGKIIRKHIKSAIRVFNLSLKGPIFDVGVANGNVYHPQSAANESVQRCISDPQETCTISKHDHTKNRKPRIAQSVKNKTAVQKNNKNAGCKPKKNHEATLRWLSQQTLKTTFVYFLLVGNCRGRNRCDGKKPVQQCHSFQTFLV